MDHVVAAEDALSSHPLLIEGQRCDCALRTFPPPHQAATLQEDILLALVVFLRRSEPERLGPATVTQLAPQEPWQHP